MLNLKKGKLIGFCINNGTKKVTKKIHFEFPEETTGVWKKKKEDEEEGVGSEEEEKEEVLTGSTEIITDSKDEKMEPFYNPKERITILLQGHRGVGSRTSYQSSWMTTSLPTQSDQCDFLQD